VIAVRKALNIIIFSAQINGNILANTGQIITLAKIFRQGMLAVYQYNR